MSRRKSKASSATFNVEYEDGRVTSNRRVPNDQLDQSFVEPIETLARAAIKSQDEEIAHRSG